MTEITFRSDVTVELLQHTGSEAMIVQAARQSTQGKNAKAVDNGRFIGFLAGEGHLVPLEHNILTFHLEVPIFVSRQIVKYRHSSISEESGRYREMEGVFYFPRLDRPVVQTGKTGDYVFEENLEMSIYAGDVLKETARYAWHSYQVALGEGIAKEVARMCLPVNLYSSMVVSMNLIGWLHFVSQRATLAPSHGQYEIAMVADAVGVQIEELYPNVWETFVTNGYKL